MRRHTFHIAAAAALFGTIVWLTVSLREQFQIGIDVPVSVENIPDGFAVRTPVPRSVHVKLRGDGWKLATLLLGSGKTLTLSASNTPPHGYMNILSELSDRLALRPGIQIVEVVPDTLTIELDRISTKRIPVEADCVLTFGNMFGQVGPLHITPDSVTITGAESVLRPISSWRTVHRTFPDLQAPLDAVVPLSESTTYLLSLSPDAVHIRAEVERYAEKVFSGIPVEIRSVPSNREVILVPPRIEVVLRAGLNQLAALGDAAIHVTADYASIVADSTGTIEPAVTVPPGVQVLQKRPERLTYIIRKSL